MALDFIAGCAGGAAGVIVGQPFDTVKVRLQTQHIYAKGGYYRGVIDCVVKVVQQESFRGLYKGLTPPLIGLAFQNAVIFGIQAQARKWVEPGVLGECLAGALTGAVQTVVTTPFELAKTKLQVQGRGESLSMTERKFKGPIQTLSLIYKEEGFRACFRGTLAVLTRDVPATSIYFGSFTYFNNLLLHPGETINSLSPMSLILTGGSAGIVSWAVVYPVDVIKSRVQAEGLKPHGRYSSYLDCIATSSREEGLRFMTQGFGATMIRAFPVNAAILATVTLFLRLANNESDVP